MGTQITGAVLDTVEATFKTRRAIGKLASLSDEGVSQFTELAGLTAKAAKGGEALGLSFTDANDQLLSRPEILDLLVLPGLVKKIEVKESAQIDEQEVEGKRREAEASDRL